MRKVTVSHAGMPSVGVKPGSRADRAHTRGGRAVIREGKRGRTPQRNDALNPGSTAGTALALGYQQGMFGPGK